MQYVEELRKKVVLGLHNTGAFKSCWPQWKNEIIKTTGTPIDPKALVVEVGSKLGAIFGSTSRDGRGQGTVSTGGSGWECLVCLYLNLCLIGTRAVVVKKGSHVPAPIRDSLTLNYGSSQTNTESDLVALIFPGEITEFDSESVSDAVVGRYIGQFEVGVIQCKTNWNDNAQIPMLWDLVYHSSGLRLPGVSIGKGPYSVSQLKAFSYSFVTVPTNKNVYKPTSMSVLRVSKLSGGVYWGRKSSQGVALSISEIFSRNFQSVMSDTSSGWLRRLEENLVHMDEKYSYFDLV